MWWIPEIKFYDVVRVYYAYFLGVVRYMNGVPPMRELSVSIPLLLIASVLFVAHTLGYVYILISKRFKIEEKRHITFFYFLGIITFIGIYMLSAIGFHSFVERYVIAGGIILLVSFWITMSTVLRNWYILIPIGFYVVLILLLKPMPSVPDYRDIAKSLDSMNNVQRYIFTSPTDYVDSEFYMSHTNVYYYYDFEGEYQGWALLDDNNGVSASNVKAGDILIAPAYDLDRFVALGYKEVSEFIPGFYTLQK
jgi:hypothetical protein